MSDTFGNRYWKKTSDPELWHSIQEAQDRAYNDQLPVRRTPSVAANAVAITGILIILAVVITTTMVGV